MTDWNELKELFDDVKSRYEILDDTDVGEAYSLMKVSSALQASYEYGLADLVKSLAYKDREAKAIQADVSRASSNKVNEGERIATSSPEVIEAWNKCADIKRSCQLVESTVKFLSRIYYDCKLVYENGCRNMRDSTKGEKLVGRV
ncbi:hypothetical protein [Veillonella seminalis]|uniref:Uncharacterized protein n=1 Tax=Veillonella seminalis ACS-216-V-Col6b TaxID=883156 RepID=K9D2C4_9FIRM|nr:hypothetical protein [Veillonella seminalis]EKU78719.1 hypothetical protein HMPREF9282_00516 [Veillonella seminalis ACS-216-V-Col6b]